MKDLLLRAHVVVKTSRMKISRRSLETSKQCTKKRAARLFFFIQPIKSLICGVAVDVAAVKSLVGGALRDIPKDGCEGDYQILNALIYS